MSDSSNSSLNPMAREFTPSPVQKSELSITTHAVPVWFPNDPQHTTLSHHDAQASYLNYLHVQEQAYYPTPPPSGPGFAAPAMPAPALFEATPPLFFEAALRDAWSQANMMAKHSAYVTGDAMIAKLASASAAFLQSQGYHPDVVVRAITIREYSAERPRRNKKTLKQAKMAVEAEASAALRQGRR